MSAASEWRQVAHPSRQGDDSECPGCASLRFHSCSWRVCDQRVPAQHTHIQSRAASWDSSGGEKISRSGLRFCGSYRFLGDARVRKFKSTEDGVNASMVSSSGFGGAASLSMVQLWLQEGTTQSALTKASPRSVAKSFLHVGDVVVRRQDTLRTRLHVVEPLVGDMRVAQVVYSRHLLPCCHAPLEWSVCFRRRRQPWKLRLELRCTESTPPRSRRKFHIVIVNTLRGRAAVFEL